MMGFSSFWLLTLDKSNVDESLYLSPLSEARLEAKFKSSLGAQPETAVKIAETLFERDPRNELARVALFDYYFMQGNISSLEEYFFPLFKLTSQEEQLVRTLVTISDTQEVFSYILRYIKEEKPNWGVLYLNEILTKTAHNPDDFISVYSHYPAWLTFLYVRLAGTVGIHHAYNAFVDIQDYSENPNQLVVDPTFSQTEFNWPFGWRFDKDAVQREVGAGASVIFLGKGTPILLEQWVKAGIGKFQIIVSMSGEASLDRGYYKLSLKCWKGRELLMVKIDDISVEGGLIKAHFEILEEECKFVELRILGQAGNFPATVRTWITSIEVIPE